MTRFGKLIAGGIIGAVLTLGMSGVALAAPVTSTTAGSPSSTVGTTGTTQPPTTAPTTTQPSTTTPSTTIPSTTIPSTTTPPALRGLPKSLTRTATEIWRIVRPHHAIDCAKSAKQLKRVQAADAAAAKRLGAWQGKNSADVKSKGKHAVVRVKHSSDKVRAFQKLEQDGQALIARIDAKCGAANSSK